MKKIFFANDPALSPASKPLLCVPLLSSTPKTLLLEAQQALSCGADVVEWRADCLEERFTQSQLLAAGRRLRQALADRPLLFTCRSLVEGGSPNAQNRQRLALIAFILEEKLADAVDIELGSEERILLEVRRLADQAGAQVLLSWHDFEGKWTLSQLQAQAAQAKRLGADAYKVAVTAKTKKQLWQVLGLPLALQNQVQIPVAAMAMGKEGRLSRVSGGVFGSALVYASLPGQETAGQIQAKRLRQIWEVLDAD